MSSATITSTCSGCWENARTSLQYSQPIWTEPRWLRAATVHFASGHSEADTRVKPIVIDLALHAAVWVERDGAAERAVYGEGVSDTKGRPMGRDDYNASLQRDSQSSRRRRFRHFTPPRAYRLVHPQRVAAGREHGSPAEPENSK